MKPRLRLIPLTIAACCVFLGVKVDELFNGDTSLSQTQWVAPAFAAEDSDEEVENEDATDEDEDAAEEGEAEEGTEETGEPEEPSNVSLTAPEETMSIGQKFNPIEVNLLQSLSERREEIDAYAAELDLKGKMLEATEIRLDEKIAKLQGLKKEVDTLLESYKVKEDGELKSLVKIYESMKPKEAARIFNELDVPIMIEVIDRMSERKVAPILAGMDPSRATMVTVKLSELRRLRSQQVEELQAVE